MVVVSAQLVAQHHAAAFLQGVAGGAGARVELVDETEDAVIDAAADGDRRRHFAAGGGVGERGDHIVANTLGDRSMVHGVEAGADPERVAARQKRMVKKYPFGVGEGQWPGAGGGLWGMAMSCWGEALGAAARCRGAAQEPQAQPLKTKDYKRNLLYMQAA